MLEPAATEEEQPTEHQRVIFRRYIEAREAGLSIADARVFAEGETDIGILRRLVARRVPWPR